MEDGTRSGFGILLRQLRVDAGLSQEALAERARMSVETIGALERGARRSPYRETVALLAGALGLSSGDRTRLEGAAGRPYRPGSRPLIEATTEGALALAVLPNLTGVAAAAASPHNLPAELSSLIGREEVAAKVVSLVKAHRLVTLVGSGGVGKTRLALRVAENLVGSFPDGICFLELAPLGNASLVAGALARMLGLQESSQRAPLENVVEALRHVAVLLVLDNCEHVLGGVQAAAFSILRTCPTVTILATSREPLSLSGEWSYRVPSLDCPQTDDLSAGAAAEFASIRLFVDRAQGASRTFLLNDENAPAVAEICRRLDGIPLAIELAAARVRMFAPRRLVQMLDERFRILTGGDPTTLPRLQTMRAAIAWSFELLGGPERVLARRLGIFADTWTLEAAEVVCSSPTLEANRILDVLASLVDKSLVTAEFFAGGARYGFLESIRAYALEQLTDAGEHGALRRRHAEWAADYSEWHAEQEFTLGQTSDVRDYPEPAVHEAFNRQAAIEWAVGAGEALLAGRIAGSYVWTATSAADARHLVEAALAQIQKTAHREVEARLWHVLSTLTRGERSFAAVQTAVGMFERIGERSLWYALSLGTLLRACRSTGRLAEALEAADDFLALQVELGATGSYSQFHTLIERADVLKDLGRFQEARQSVIDAMALTAFRAHTLKAKNSLAELESDMGNVRRAAVIAEEAAATVKEAEWDRLLSSDRAAMSALRFNAAAYRIMLGEVEAARIAALDALKLAPRQYSSISGRNVAIPAQHLATIAALRGDAESGARLMGYVDAWYATAGEVREPTEQRTHEILVAVLRTLCGSVEMERLAAEGALLSSEEAFEIAFAIGQAPAS